MIMCLYMYIGKQKISSLSLVIFVRAYDCNCVDQLLLLVCIFF